MNLAEWLVRRAKLSPRSPALFRGTAMVGDYRGFARSAAGIGQALAKRFGIRPGDRVAIVASNCTGYLEAMYGIWFAGAVAVPVNAKLHGREAAWILEDSGAKLVFVTEKAGNALAPYLPECCRTVVDLASDEFAAMRAADGGDCRMVA